VGMSDSDRRSVRLFFFCCTYSTVFQSPEQQESVPCEKSKTGADPGRLPLCRPDWEGTSAPRHGRPRSPKICNLHTPRDDDVIGCKARESAYAKPTNDRPANTVNRRFFGPSISTCKKYHFRNSGMNVKKTRYYHAHVALSRY
jgi:hypothetical protein